MSAGRIAPLAAHVCLLLVWGYNWIPLKLAMAYSGPFNFAATRALIGALTLLAVLPLTGRSIRPVRLRETLLLGFVQTTIFVTLSQLSLVEGGAGRSAVLVFTMPFWTLLFAAVVLGERIRGAQRWAVGLAAVGLVILLEPWALGGSLKSKIIAVAAGASWAASAVIAKRIQNRAPVDLVSLTAWQMLFGAVILLAFSSVAGEPETNWSLAYVAILVFTGAVSTGFGWLVWLYVLQRVSAGVAGMSMLAIPVIATASSAVQLGERLNVNEYAGIALIVTALVILSKPALRAHRTPGASAGAGKS